MSLFDFIRAHYPCAVVVSNPLSTPAEVRSDAYAMAASIISAQTLTLFIDTAYMVKSLIPASNHHLTMNQLVALAANRTELLIRDRPNLCNVYFALEIATNAPCHFRSDPPDIGSVDPRMAGLSIDPSKEDDFILGKMLYSAKDNALAALTDVLMHPVFFSIFYARLLNRLRSFLPSLERKVCIHVMYPIFRHFRRLTGEGETVADLVHPNHLFYDVATAKVVSSIHADCFMLGEVHSFLRFVLDVIERADLPTADRASHTVEVHSDSDDCLAVLLTHQLTDSPDVMRISPTLWSSHGIVSIEGLVAEMAQKCSKQQILTFVAMFIAVFGTGYVPGMLTPVPSTDDELIISSFLLTLLKGDLEIAAFMNKTSEGMILQINTKRMFNFICTLHYARLTGIPTGVPDPGALNIDKTPAIDSAVFVSYYMDLCSRPIGDLKEEEFPVGLIPEHVLIADMEAENPNAAQILRQTPFAGHLHPLNLLRRIHMAAWMLSYYLFGHTGLYNGTLPPQSENQRQPIVAVTPAMRLYRLEYDNQLTTLLEDVGVGCSPSGRRGVLWNGNELEKSPVLFFLPALAGETFNVDYLLQIESKKPSARFRQTTLGLNEMVRACPVFWGVSVNIPLSDAGMNLAPGVLDPETLAFVILMSTLSTRLQTMHADKIMLLNAIDPGWMQRYTTIYIDNMSEGGAPTPDEALCLLYVYGLALMRVNRNMLSRDISGNLVFSYVNGAGVPRIKRDYCLHVPSGVLHTGSEDAETKYKTYPASSSSSGSETIALGYFKHNPKQERISGRESWALERTAFVGTEMADRRLISGTKLVEWLGMRIKVEMVDANNEKKLGIISMVPEVCDYAYPRLRHDATPYCWDGWMHEICGIWTDYMEAAWLDVLRFKLYQGSGARDVDGLTKLVATNASRLFNDTRTFRTWIFAYYHYKHADVFMGKDSAPEMHSMINTKDGVQILTNLSTSVPILDGMEVSIARGGVSVFFTGWDDRDIDIYISHAIKTAFKAGSGALLSRIRSDAWVRGQGHNIIVALDSGEAYVNFYSI